MKTTTAVQLNSRFFSFQNLLIYVVKLDTMIESIEEIKVFGIKLINSGDFFELLLRLLLNTFVVYWISNRVYVKNNQDYQFYFGYNTISIVTFLMCFYWVASNWNWALHWVYLHFLPSFVFVQVPFLSKKWPIYLWLLA